MGLFGRLFKKKEPLNNCDWCGTDFAEAGTESGGLLFCSAACVEAKDAPAVERTQRAVHQARELTVDEARSALKLARDELVHFAKFLENGLNDDRIDGSPNLEAETNQREFELWRSLDDVRQVAVREQLNVGGYDALRERSVVNTIEIRRDSDVSLGLGLTGPKLRRTSSVTADFAAGNIERMAEAIEALEATFRGLGLR
ncbi:MAG: hypothetical protein AAF799_04475 [Myxococcota bacterium]